MITDVSFYRFLYQNEELYVLPQEESQLTAVATATELPIVEEIKPTNTEEGAEEELILPFATNILILTVTQGKGLTNEEHVLLQNILKAIGLDMNQVDVMDLSVLDSEVIRQGMNTGAISRLVIFGPPIGLSAVPLHTLNYTPTQIGEALVLKSDPLQAIALDVNLKRQLWKGLQELFKAN